MWAHSPNGIYTSSSAWNVARTPQPSIPIFSARRKLVLFDVVSEGLNPNQMHESTWCLLMGYHSIITMAHVWGILELSSLLECSVMESVIFLVPNYIALVSLLFRFWCSSKIGVRLTIKALACGSLTGLLTCLIIDLPNTSIVELFYVNIPNKKRRFEY